MSSSALDASFVLINKNEQEQSPNSSKDSKPVVKGYAHDWSEAATGKITTHGRNFVDAYGRVCMLRGVNLSGSCKSPVNHSPDNFLTDYQTVTFVGRPFPLEEAHEHFARLRRWGLTFVRFLITWEAVEHAGPGKYDLEYLKYIRAVLSLLPQYGMRAFVSMHQDVWSRYSGGSGAPAWTLEAVGFDLNNLEETGAAWLHGVRNATAPKVEHRGLWPTGYQKLAASTMSTVFWGGDIFAPKLKIQRISAQKFLQDTFLECWKVVAQHVGDLEGVLGFDIMNEPHRGYIELPSLHGFDYNTDLHLHEIPSALQSMLLGAGHPTSVPYYKRSFPMPTKLSHHVELNPNGVSAWRKDGPTGGKCLWEMHGVWGWDESKKTGVPLRENYFKRDPTSDKAVDWYTDLYYPFLKRWAEVVRTASSADKIVFVEPIPNEFCPPSWTPENQLSQMVFSPHWYDLNALFQKAFGNFTINVQGLSKGMFLLKTFYWGVDGARENYSLQLKNLADAGYRSLGERPVFIGETGIPMDLNEQEAFKTGNFTWQAKMMDALMSGLERNLLGFTLWNYNPANDDIHGDSWNTENFSWFSNSRARPLSSSTTASLSQTTTSLDDGGRILETIVRPYAAKVAGIPVRFHYEVNTGRVEFIWVEPSSEQTSSRRGYTQMEASTANPPITNHPPITLRRTEIFLPSSWLTDLENAPPKILLFAHAAGAKHWIDPAVQTLYIETEGPKPPGSMFTVVIRAPKPKMLWEVNTFWDDYGLHILALTIGLVAWILLNWELYQYVPSPFN